MPAIPLNFRILISARVDPCDKIIVARSGWPEAQVKISADLPGYFLRDFLFYMIEEIWKGIPDFEGLYEASNFGRIRSLDKKRRTANPEKFYIKPGQILKCVKHNSGYLQVGLFNNKRQNCFLVHILIAKTFIPNHFGKKYINHIDANKSNNRIENLEWCTAKENVDHAIVYGKKRAPKKHLTHSDISKILEMGSNGQSIHDILKEVNRVTISSSSF